MPNSQTFSTNKIILLVVFFSAALISSLFIFHLRNKPSQPIISSGNALVFPIAREIKPFELATAADKPFTQKDFYNHWTLLFFGFTHCAKVCPTTLSMINRIYPTLHTRYPNLQVVLISLDPERDTPEQVNKYAQSFNPAFIGATGKIQELRKIQSQLGIYSARDTSQSMTNYQIQHTASILLINPQGKWYGIYKYGMKPDEFAQAFSESVDSAA